MITASKTLLCCAMTVAALAGCAGGGERARSNYEYLKEKNRAPLKIPAGMDQPNRYKDFQIPQVKRTEAMSMGSELVISAPAQVLTLVDGSIRPQDGNRASIEFDVTARAGDAPAEQIWASIHRYLKNNDVQVQRWEKDRGLLLTDWYVSHQEDDPSYFFGLEDYLMERRGDLEARARYLFQVSLSPSGRTAKLSASMEAFERYLDNKLERSQPTALERDNFTVNFLNAVVMQYQKDVTSIRMDKSKAKRRALSLSLNTDEYGNGSIGIAYPFEQTWPHIGPLLKQAGFELEDQDKSQATYYVTVPSRWLSGLFGLGSAELDMDSGDYKILVADKGNASELSFYDSENQPVKAGQVEKAYNALKLALVKYSQDDEPVKPVRKPAK